MSDDALALLDQAAGEAMRMRRGDLAARLEAQRGRVIDPACQVLVVGEFKKGKSSLINALLDTDACPADAVTATAAPTIVRYGPAPAATLVTEPEDDGGGPAAVERRDIDLGSVRALVTDEARTHATGRRIQAVDIQLPRELLRQGLILIDTPGVGGGLASAHAAATLRALTLADALVFVSDASQEYTAPELDFLRRAVQMCPAFVCVLTKIDFYPEWRRIVALDLGHLVAGGLEAEILPVSVPLHEHALRTGEEALDAESGVGRLADHLRDRLLGAKAALAVRGAAAAVRSVLGQLGTGLATEQATLADPRVGAALLRRLQDAQRRADEQRGATARWQQTLADQVGEMAATLDTDLTLRVRAIRKEAGERVSAGDPARAWPELQAWLTMRTNEEVAGHFALLRERAQAVAAEVASHFTADAAATATVPADFGVPDGWSGVDTRTAEVGFERYSRLELGLMAARGSVSGFAIGSTVAGMVATATALSVASAGVMLLPATAAAATMLARSTLRQLRDHQLRVNRTEALRALGAYLDEADLLARKASRDTVRQVNRRLRDDFTARAEELHTSAQRNLATTATAVKRDQDSRRRRLREVTAELERLRALLAEADRLERLVPPPLAGTVGRP
jgi:hypothetical protein